MSVEGGERYRFGRRVGGRIRQRARQRNYINCFRECHRSRLAGPEPRIYQRDSDTPECKTMICMGVFERIVYFVLMDKNSGQNLGSSTRPSPRGGVSRKYFSRVIWTR